MSRTTTLTTTRPAMSRLEFWRVMAVREPKVEKRVRWASKGSMVASGK
jgi:hypothetical protein